MSEATRTFESKKELYRREIANLREIVRDLEDQIREKLELLANYQSKEN